MLYLRNLAIGTLTVAAAGSRTALAFAPPMQNGAVVGNTNGGASAFAFRTATARSTPLNMIDPTSLAADSANLVSAATDLTTSLTTSMGTNPLLAFSDQGNNLAGIFFQCSLLPYLAFLYFLSFRGNRTPDLGNFGWQYLLLFVLGTIPSGIITKSVYGQSLANTDWLHGGAEALLTITNVLILLGFREAMNNPNFKPGTSKYGQTPKIIAGVAVLTFAAACFTGTSIGFEGHSQFLFGLGNLPESTVLSLPFVVHSEPENALSIPTWAIHFSSVFEFLFAMDTIWKFAETTDNPKWKGLTWGMLPLHASGICACTYHIFYNASSLQYLVESQAFLTLLGNLTCAIAAYRIAISNGWTLKELNPFPKSETSPEGFAIDEAAALPYNVVETSQSEIQLAVKLAALTLSASYIVKYGELSLDLPFEANGFAATAIIAGLPAITAYTFYNRGKLETGEGFQLPSFGGSGEDGEGGLSMADVKKFGVSGTVAYVITELAFWAVAFPVASNALYQTTGHWPDVINDTTDRGAVLAFIFGAANIARLLVPVRLGAALALAPWVDDNIINRGDASDEQS